MTKGMALKIGALVGMAILRASAGLFAGFVLALLTLRFLGLFHGHGDLGLIEMQEEERAKQLAFWIGCGVAVGAVVIGWLRVSTYWMWSAAAFGVIGLIPFWMHKGTRVPLATPYVNFGYHFQDVVLLVIHTCLALAAGAIVHFSLRRFIRRGGLANRFDAPTKLDQ